MLYSFKVFSSREVDLHDHLMTIGAGLDTFTVTTNDIEGLKDHLILEEVKILECNRLDDLEPITPEPEVKEAFLNLTSGLTNQLLGGTHGQDLLGSERDKME